ncbi:gasdermin Eb [Mugil cephalus]|uniref:gasdermin Eb n=1 Tax=Mugil cephalus TaxID=48193 RepID=UPI001FB581B1|nr:gasdermin Eb [Mugil cephalus]XP_047454506.1 gasdermin Eb [Mugil cephalus]
MLAIATRNFVEEVDRGGLLIPVSSLNDTIALLTVVVKRKRFWFWQKPKYLPTDFTLNDLVTGDTPLQPVVVETDFIKYSGTFGDNIKGTVGANLANTTVNLEGKDSSKLQSSFGSLKKEEINVQKLLRDSKDRMLDMSHSLIQQAKEKHRRVFGIVKERIVTTQPCSVIEDVQQEGQCGGVLGICGKKNPKIALKENGNLSTDSNVTMEIPIHTTIAYGLIELVVKHDGHFELCLMSDTDGGFEVDSSNKPRLVGMSGAPAHSSEQSSSLRQELEKLSDHFKLLSSLSVSIKSSLLKQITKLMQDQASISALQHVLDQICLEKVPDLDDATMTESARQNIKAILDLLEKSGQMGSTQAAGPSTSALTAIHLLTSALDEMTNDCFAVLGMCCSPTVLATLEQLVQCVLGNGELPLSSLGLAEDVYEKTEHLFASSKISLKRDGDVLKTEINPQPGNLPLILCIVIRSLASLAHGV